MGLVLVYKKQSDEMKVWRVCIWGLRGEKEYGMGGICESMLWQGVDEVATLSTHIWTWAIIILATVEM